MAELKNPWQVENWNLTEQTLFIRKHGRAKADTFALAAGSFVGAASPPGAERKRTHTTIIKPTRNLDINQNRDVRTVGANAPADGDVLTWDSSALPAPGQWVPLAPTDGGGDAPASAQYLTLALDGTLTGERVFTPRVGFSTTDAGANAAYTLDAAATTLMFLVTGAGPIIALTADEINKNFTILVRETIPAPTGVGVLTLPAGPTRGLFRVANDTPINFTINKTGYGTSVVARAGMTALIVDDGSEMSYGGVVELNWVTTDVSSAQQLVRIDSTGLLEPAGIELDDSASSLTTILTSSEIDARIGAAVITDHGALTGLADDDHTQYSLVTGTRSYTGDVTIDNAADNAILYLIPGAGNETGQLRYGALDNTLNLENVQNAGIVSFSAKTAGGTEYHVHLHPDHLSFHPDVDGGLDLGTTSGGNERWRDLHLTRDAYVGNELRLVEPGGSNYSAFKAQAQGGDVTYTLPAADAVGALTSDGAGSLSWAAAGVYTDEQAQDAVGTILVDSASIDFAYNDGVPSITATVIQAGLDHGSIGGLPDDDHPQYLLAAGTRALTGNWDAGSFEIRAETFESDVATGTAPFTIASTTKVTNLNADLLDGLEAAAFTLRSTLTAKGSIYAATAAATPADLPVGADGLFLKTNSATSTGLEWAAGGAGVTDHGALTGLSDDDHAQYLLIDGTRAMTGTLDLIGPTSNGSLRSPTNSGFLFTSRENSDGSAVGFLFETLTKLSTSGDTVFQFKSGGTSCYRAYWASSTLLTHEFRDLGVLGASTAFEVVGNAPGAVLTLSSLSPAGSADIKWNGPSSASTLYTDALLWELGVNVDAASSDRYFQWFASVYSCSEDDVADLGASGARWKTLFVGTGTSQFDGHVGIGNAKELRLYEPTASGTNYSAFKAQAQAANVTYTLPAADAASNGQVLSSDGAGTLTWQVPAIAKIANQDATGNVSVASVTNITLATASLTTAGAGVVYIWACVNIENTAGAARIYTIGLYKAGALIGESVIESLPSAANRQISLLRASTISAGTTAYDLRVLSNNATGTQVALNSSIIVGTNTL